jgi:hypothetical protein
LHLVTKAANTPKTANHGAKTTLTNHSAAGISSKVFPPSSLTITQVAFPSFSTSLKRSSKLFPEIVYSSLVNLGIATPQPDKIYRLLLVCTRKTQEKINALLSKQKLYKQGATQIK